MNRNGLSANEVLSSREKHGSNTLTQIPPAPLWKKFLHGFKDPMIMILLVALVVQLIMYFCGETHWYEPIGVLLAILIANGVSSISEHSQENKASALKADEEAKEMTKVVRDGQLLEIHVSEVVVGDLIFLQAGDRLPADGEIVDGEVKIDQAALNGETEEAAKRPVVGAANYNVKDLLNEHYAYRGTVVCGGEAYMEVKVVGDKTLFGELALEVQEDTRATPLQVKLGGLAKHISMFGYVGAVAIIIGIVAVRVCTDASPDDFMGWLKLLLNAVTVAVTIIVCAVPEGLPMLTSILLSLQSIKMIKDNVLVRKINGLETAGSLSLLYSDKTGTITEGRLSVVEMVTGNVTKFTHLNQIPANMSMDIITGIGVNNSASVSGKAIIGGNSTDRALMAFLAGMEMEGKINKDEVRAFSPFDSTKKCSSVTVSHDGKAVTYIKGAPERLIERCTHYLDEKGQRKELVEKNYLMSYVDTQAGRSMRLLAAAKVDGESDAGNDLTLVCVFSIRDNVRKEAVDAITQVKGAGIQVVMVTGDRKETAVAIAKEAKLLTNDDDVALTSAELADKSDDEVKELLPLLRVVARALPTDKSRLVRLAQELNLVVGMTGDGVNDSPALKKADVGFAMGSGTEVAKEAGDITILDDNFSSIRKAILYGRTMFKSIQKFLIFQLTVNVAAVLTCFLGPLIGHSGPYEVILTVVQLLMVNLAMDTLAAIAFGSEPALDEYMNEKPIARSASIVTREMMTQIVVGALYVTAICLGILFIPAIGKLMGCTEVGYLKTAVFATFMLSITFNGFNARTKHLNPFTGLTGNRSFLVVMLGIVLMQYLFITFGGKVLSVQPLSLRTWLVCAALAAVIIPLDMIRKLLMKSWK